MKRRIYLDSAASHPVRSSALRAHNRAVTAHGNPSAPHEEGRHASRILEDARTRIARACGAKPDAVIFTSGATESNALAIVGHVRARLNEGAVPNQLRVLFSPAQHASVIGAIEEIRALGAKVEPVPLVEGALDMASLTRMIGEGVSLITLDVICGETGTRFDVLGVRRIIDQLPLNERPVFHVDATQAPLIENMERTRLGADLITFDAQKIGGVRGIGALIAPRTIMLAPLVPGGGQERGLRSGTQSPALAASFARALEDAVEERVVFTRRAEGLKDMLLIGLREAIPDVKVNGGKQAAPTILNISFCGRDTDYLVALLSEAGFAVSTKSACESSEEGSRVVLAYTQDAARAASTLRISLHAHTSARHIRAFARALVASVAFIDAAS